MALHECLTQLHVLMNEEVYIHFALIKSDVDDNKFVDCAVAADAEYIVTNDTHFDILKEIPWPKVSVIKIKDFMNQIKPQ